MANAFGYEELDGKIGLLTFDLPDAKVNTISQAVLLELAQRIGELEKRSDLYGLLLQSGKPGQFIAGADLKELGALAYSPPELVGKALAMGHHLFGRIASLPFPTVALIDGNCLGGGTELALTMDERIASNDPETKIGLPEVKVGLIPAWGGTQRLPRLVGLHAIEIITSGEPVSAARAVQIGLAFDAVPRAKLVEEGKRLLGILRENDAWKASREKRAQPLGLSRDQLAFAFGTAEGVVREKTKGQYPAPLAALKAIREGAGLPLVEGLKAEQAAAMEVVGTSISANLIAVFFMSNRLARDPGVADKSIGPGAIKRVGVLGAGLMGSGIAAAHARAGIPATMVDIDDDRINSGLKRASEVVLGRIKIGRASAEDLAKMLALLNTSTAHSALEGCDLVVEAIVEDEKAKTAAYKELAPRLKPEAILASNTSTISITRMAEVAPTPERFIGMHFFHPVDRMQLVEVIRGAKTDDHTAATIVELSKRIKKTPIVVRDCAGFLVNRVLFPYMNEALQLLQEGVSMDAIDKAAVKFGMPVGPIALSDMVGLDTSLYAGKVLAAAYPDRTAGSPIIYELVKAGRLGEKNGAGFRKFDGKKGKPREDPAALELIAKHKTGDRQLCDEEITDRLFLPMLMEATRTLEEGIVREPADVDMGLILGIGFPPFKGGILRWADAAGIAKIVDRAGLHASLGKRFQPTDSLLALARDNGLFYPRPKLTAMG